MSQVHVIPTAAAKVLRNDERSSIARAKLGQIVEHGQKQAKGVVAQIMASQPKDELSPASLLSFTLDGAGQPLLNSKMGHDALTDHSFGQLADRLSPRLRSYAGQLLEGAPWQRDLLKDVVNTHLEHAGEKDRFLLRHMGGQIRGVLSDSYKRIDSRPLLDAFMGAASGVGAIVVSGFSTETRHSIRAILPRVIEPIAGEAMVFGLQWGNSDFGAGSYAITAFAMRLICLNGMVGETQLKKVHLGSRLTEGELQLSDETLDSDHKTLSLATRDVVRGVLSADSVEARVSAVAAAAGQETSFEAAWSKVGKALSKADRDRVKAAYEGPDTLNLPAGQNMWRFSNALSFIANADGVSADHKLELQALAGQVVAGF